MWLTLRPDAATVLKDKNARKSLSRYFEVMQNSKIAKFLIARKLATKFKSNDPIETLWKIHSQVLKEFTELQYKLDNHLTSLEELKIPAQSFLDLKVTIANRIVESCHFCARRCNVNRKEGILGYCKCGSKITVSAMFEHMGEEPELVPSGTIFTLGCTLRCSHCQNWTISQWVESGKIYSSDQLAKSVENLRNRGCRNANLVGGDPTPWLAQWLETFKKVNVNVPVVWNSNAYYSEETAKLLAGFVDLYLLDFKYGNNECAKRISDTQNYWEICTRNHIHGKEYGELLIRVLVLPNHLNCCVEAILRWIGKKLGYATRTNIMFQYRPEWRAHEIPDLQRRLTRAEREKAILLAKKAGLYNFIT
ncbi:MAG: radical SAM protein [Candidatus Bathyarchaeota archaeon]|nr:MAG: radical SAM protein [Candidatus Bathyarchaeota archaeon]